MHKYSYATNSIMREYKIRKKYEEKQEMKKFQSDNCTDCINKDTDKCEIRRNINNQLMCVYKNNGGVEQ